MNPPSSPSGSTATGPTSPQPTPPTEQVGERSASRRQRAPRMNRDDQEFLPAALEILERPASPVGMALLLLICAAAVAAFAWAWLGHTDVVAVASGKVQPTGRVKTVQLLEGGRVKAIKVQNGQRVRQGDPLVELDPADALEDIRALTASIHSLRAEVTRRQRNVALAQGMASAGSIPWPDDLPETIRLREEGLQRSETQVHLSQLNYLEGMRLQKRAERQRIVSTLEPLERLIAVLQERVNTRSELAVSRFVSHAAVLDASEELHKQQAALVRERGQLAEVERSLELMTLERERLRSDFVSEHMLKANEARRQLDELEPRLAKAQQRLERMTARSPVDGVVHASALTSLGQVIHSGQEIMRVVPQDGAIEFEVYVPNKDIGFIRVGQDVSIKVEAYPYTRYGMIAGKVKKIAQDAIPEPDARQLEADPTRLAPALQAAGAQRMQSLVFPIVITSDEAALQVDGQSVPLTPGMAIVAEIKTDQRRILDYLLSPIQQVTGEAMRER